MADGDFDYEAQMKQFENAGLSHKDANVAAAVVGENLRKMWTDKQPSEEDIGVKSQPTDVYPQSMRVGTKIFRIHWWSHYDWENSQMLGRDNKGKTHAESSTVHIRTSIIYDDEPKVELQYGLQDMAETLIHEALHCMYIETMLDKNPIAKGAKYRQEEYTVQVLAVLTAGFIQDNPDVIEWVQAARPM